ASLAFSLLAFFLLCPRPPTSTLFPYTTLFRSAIIFYTQRIPSAKDMVCPIRRFPFLAAASPNNVGKPIFVPIAFQISTAAFIGRSEEHTSELQSRFDLVCRLLLEKKKTQHKNN